MKKKKYLIFIFTLVFLIIISILLVSYAFFVGNTTGNEESKKTTLISRLLQITYADGNESIVSGVKGNFIPGSIIEKTFTIENTGDEVIKYSIKLTGVENNFKRKEDLSYELYLGETLLTSDIFPSVDIGIAYNQSINTDEKLEYTLKIIYKASEENQIVDTGKTINAQLEFIEQKTNLTNIKILGNSIQNEPSIESPQEIQSVGNLIESEDELNGKYEIPIEVTGKNLFDFTKVTHSKYEILDNGIKIVNAYQTGTNITPELFLEMTGLKEGDQITTQRTVTLLSGTNAGVIGRFIFSQKNSSSHSPIILVDYNQTSNTVTIPEGFNSTNYHNLWLYGRSSGEVLLSNIQIEKGTTPTEYEPYYKKTYNLYLDEPLRKVGDCDTCYDYIDFANKLLVQNTKSKTFTEEDTSWSLGNSETNTINQRYYYSLSDVLSNGRVMSNMLPEIYPGATTIFNKDESGCNISNGKYFQFKIPIELLTNAGYTTSVADYQSYLKSLTKDLNIIYQLESPINTPIELPNMDTFATNSNITVKTNIEPSIVIE